MPVIVVFSSLQCSHTCGAGEQTRAVLCVAGNGDAGAKSAVLPDNKCDGAVRPTDKQRCDEGPCDRPEWMTSDWSGVSLTRLHTSTLLQKLCIRILLTKVTVQQGTACISMAD